MRRRPVLIATLWIAAIGVVLAVQQLRAPTRDTSARTPTSTRRERGVPVALDVQAAPRMLHGDRRHHAVSRLRGPASPALAWTFTTGAPVVAQPVVDPRGRVIVGSLGLILLALGR